MVLEIYMLASSVELMRSWLTDWYPDFSHWNITPLNFSLYALISVEIEVCQSFTVLFWCKCVGLNWWWNCQFQITTLPDDFPDAHSTMNGLRLEYVVAIEGVVRPRPAESVNKKMKTGTIEVTFDDLLFTMIISRFLPSFFGVCQASVSPHLWWFSFVLGIITLIGYLEVVTLRNHMAIFSGYCCHDDIFFISLSKNMCMHFDCSPWYLLQDLSLWEENHRIWTWNLMILHPLYWPLGHTCGPWVHAYVSSWTLS